MSLLCNGLAGMYSALDWSDLWLLLTNQAIAQYYYTNTLIIVFIQFVNFLYLMAQNTHRHKNKQLY